MCTCMYTHIIIKHVHVHVAAAYELLKKKGRLFSFGGNNAFLEFFLEGVPGVLQTHMDSKKVGSGYEWLEWLSAGAKVYMYMFLNER